MNKRQIVDRDSNIELLRIVAMLMVTFNHIYSLTDITINQINSNSLLALFFFQGGKVGSLLFVLAGAMFIGFADGFKLKNVFRIWICTLFYSLILSLVEMLVFKREVDWVRTLLPVIGGHYWFSKSYIIYLFLLPIVRNLMKYKLIRNIILVSGTVIYLICTVTLSGALTYNHTINWALLNTGRGYMVFIYITCMLIFFVNYSSIDAKMTKWSGLIIGVALWILMLAIEVFILTKGLYSNDVTLIENFDKIRDMNSLLCIGSALGFFWFFKKCVIKKSNIINSIASLVFGVYLFQCYSKSIWNIFPSFNNIMTRGSFYVFITYCITIVIFFFAAGIAIECFRSRFFFAFEEKICSSSIFVKLDKMINEFYNRFNQLINRLYQIKSNK